jgi:hypothetical protein
MDERKEIVMAEIDEYYDMMVLKLNERREQVKMQYKDIESREKRRLNKISLKLEKTSDEFKDTENELQIYAEEFSLDMDFQANKAGFNMIKERYEEVMAEHLRKAYFLRNAKYVPPSFQTVRTDVEGIMDIGRIVDNCEFTRPLTLMNTYNFELLEYSQSIRSFARINVEDDKNQIDSVPKYFKSVLLSNDEVAILGGYDHTISNSSNKVFSIINGRIMKANPMFYARQYFSM